MRYFLCDKCGSSILFVPDNEGAGGMCTEENLLRSSGICGGGFTVELVRKVWDPRKESVYDVIKSNPQSLGSSMEDVYDPLVKIKRKRSRFLVQVGKIKLTYTMAQKKAGELRRIDEKILKLSKK